MKDHDRRSFLKFLAPLAVLPVVGPSMMLSDKPTFLGWLKEPKLKEWKYLKEYIVSYRVTAEGNIEGYSIKHKNSDFVLIESISVPYPTLRSFLNSISIGAELIPA